MDSWDDLRFVLAVMEEGSLNAAARRLGVNHATVLRRVNAFEARCGARIFERTPTGYRTVATLSEARAALVRMGQAAVQARRIILGQVAGPVRITSTDSLCERLVPQALNGLKDHYPDLQIDLLSSNRYLDLSQSDAELTIRPAARLPDDLDGQEAGAIRMQAYASAAYLARMGQGPHLWLSGSGVLRRAHPVQWIDTQIEPQRIVQRADSFVTLRAMARLGEGVALLPDFLVGETDELVPIDGLAPPMSIPVWVAHHRDLAGFGPLIACRKHLVDVLPGLLAGGVQASESVNRTAPM